MSGIITDNLGKSSGLVKAASVSGGKILQVVGATCATEASHTSTSYTDSGLDVAITPSASSSKIYVIATTGMSIVSGYYWYCTLYRDATDLTGGDAQGQLAVNSQTKNTEFESSFSWLDSPSSTSELTYSLYVRAETSGKACKSCGGDAMASITAFEIDGS